MGKDWDFSKVDLNVGGVIVDEPVSFTWNPGDELTHIESSNGVSGFNEGHQKPTATLVVKATSYALRRLTEIKNNRERVQVTFKAPGILVQLYNVRIKSISYGSIGAEAPDVTIEMLALRCTEEIDPEAA
ncbi:MAG TPA: hypothetical protein PKH75_12400 [Bacillota bacterium]|nr:hypothetical protein [Bacillota bacterium]